MTTHRLDESPDTRKPASLPRRAPMCTAECRLDDQMNQDGQMNVPQPRTHRVRR